MRAVETAAARRARRASRSRRRRRPRRRRPPPRSTAALIRSGRLWSSGGSGRTSRSQPRRLAIALTCSASAPQVTTTGSFGKGELVDEQVVEVGAARELDVAHLVEHGLASGALGHRQRRDLRSLAGHVARPTRSASAAASARARCESRSPARGTCRTSRRAAPARRPPARCRGRGRGSSSRSRSRPSRTGARARRAARG